MEQRRFPVFAERFSKLRGDRTQEEFAKFLGISRPTVGFYENGTRLPDALVLCQIAEKCNVSTDWILGLSNYKNSGTANLSVEDIGLSENATTTLAELSQGGRAVDAKKIAVLNLLLEDDGMDEWGNHLLHCIAEYLFAEPIPKQPLQFTSEGVKVLEGAIDFLDSKQDIPNFEYVDVLYDKLLIDRVTRATEGARYQLRNPQTIPEVYAPLVLDEGKRRLQKEAKKNGKLQDND